MSKTVVIGMSGGVDSSVAALLLKEQGYNVIGLFMQNWDETDENGCCTAEDDFADVRRVSAVLDIPYYTVNFAKEYMDRVFSYFLAEYKAGRTPNPDVLCNREIKFGPFLEEAKKLGADYIATGHYCKIAHENGIHYLQKAKDQNKDQTYFLYTLTQHQLAHTLFPLGKLTKEQVREIAQAEGLLNARKRDSQDICFIPNGDYFSFLESYTGKHYPQGDYLDLSGKVVGRHRGAAAYTIGQRKGLGIALGAPVYVCSKNMERNTVTVGPNEALFTSRLTADHLNWIPFPTLRSPMELTAKIRHSQHEQRCTVIPQEDQVQVIFAEPQRAVTPGQAVVFYQDDMVVGGGRICATAE